MMFIQWMGLSTLTLQSKKFTNLLYTLAIIIAWFVWGTQTANAQIQKHQEDFTNKWKVSAVKYGKKYGIFPSQILAQGAFESDWGRSALAVNNNNIYGIRNGSNGWMKFESQDACVEYYILNFFKTQAGGYEEIIKTNSPIGVEKYITMGYAPLSDGNSNYLTTYPTIVENKDTNFLQYDLMAFPSEEKKYADIQQVRGGATSGLKYHSSGKIDWKGKKPTITDKTIKVDGIDTSNSASDKEEGEKEEKLNVSYSFDESKIPGMPKYRDYEDGQAYKLGEQGGELDVADGDQILKWKEEYDNKYRHTGVNTIRGILTAIGRILIIYAVVLIACYMYDLTKVHEGSLFTLFTFGKLAVSYDGTSTFKDKNSNMKLVNKKDLLFIVILLILIGTAIVTGLVYTGLSKLTEWVSSIIELLRNKDIFLDNKF